MCCSAVADEHATIIFKESLKGKVKNFYYTTELHVPSAGQKTEQENHKKKNGRNLKSKHGKKSKKTKSSKRNKASKHQKKSSKQNKRPSLPTASPSLLIVPRPVPFSWLQLGVDIDGEASGDGSGGSVSLSANGETVAIGATFNDGNGYDSGHTRVFKWNQSTNTWEQMGNDMDGEASGDYSGGSVSLSGNGETVAIGARRNDGNGSFSGHTRAFKWNQSTNTWEQMGNDMDGEESGDESGGSVSLSANGETVAIGATFNDGNGNISGHTRVFKWNQSTNTWQQMGNDMDGEASGHGSGQSVSLSGNGETVAIKADWYDDGAYSGHIRTRVFKWNQSTNTWQQMGNDMDGEASGDYSGQSVSLSANGETVAIGADWYDGNGSFSGHTRVFKWNQSTYTWQQMGNDMDGEASFDWSGGSVSLSGNGETVAIGAVGNDGNGYESGHTRVFKWNQSTNTWQQIGNDMDGEASGDYSGGSVSLSGNGETVAIGAKRNGGNGTDIGHVRVYSFSNGV